MEDSFAKVEVISGNFFQDSKNFLSFPQNEDGVSQPVKEQKNNYRLDTVGPKSLLISWTGMNSFVFSWSSSYGLKIIFER